MSLFSMPCRRCAARCPAPPCGVWSDLQIVYEGARGGVSGVARERVMVVVLLCSGCRRALRVPRKNCHFIQNSPFIPKHRSVYGLSRYGK